jgi:hypothetical protein
MVGTNMDRDHRERQPKGYTNHEGIAARAGRPAGKPSLFLIEIQACAAATNPSHPLIGETLTYRQLTVLSFE